MFDINFYEALNHLERLDEKRTDRQGRWLKPVTNIKDFSTIISLVNTALRSDEELKANKIIPYVTGSDARDIGDIATIKAVFYNDNIPHYNPNFRCAPKEFVQRAFEIMINCLRDNNIAVDGINSSITADSCTVALDGDLGRYINGQQDCVDFDGVTFDWNYDNGWSGWCNYLDQAESEKLTAKKTERESIRQRYCILADKASRIHLCLPIDNNWKILIYNYNGIYYTIKKDHYYQYPYANIFQYNVTENKWEYIDPEISGNSLYTSMSETKNKERMEKFPDDIEKCKLILVDYRSNKSAGWKWEEQRFNGIIFYNPNENKDILYNGGVEFDEFNKKDNENRTAEIRQVTKDEIPTELFDIGLTAGEYQDIVRDTRSYHRYG